jgi:hypothetical protein
VDDRALGLTPDGRRELAADGLSISDSISRFACDLGAGAASFCALYSAFSVRRSFSFCFSTHSSLFFLRFAFCSSTATRSDFTHDVSCETESLATRMTTTGKNLNEEEWK